MIHSPFFVKYLGCQDYVTTLQAMKLFTDSRDENTMDELWMLEHQPVFTQGQAGKEEHVLHYSNIPLIKTDRGGQVTYHGPGQLVVYFLFNIKRKNISVRDFVGIMEQSVINMLTTYGIHAELKPGAPGVYVDGAKIASLGLRVRKGCTYHGLSLNVDMDLSPFMQINPCGYKGLAMTQISELAGCKVSVDDAGRKLLKAVNNFLANDVKFVQ